MPFTFDSAATPPGAFSRDVHVDDPVTGVSYSHIEYAVMAAAPGPLEGTIKHEPPQEYPTPPSSYHSEQQHQQHAHPLAQTQTQTQTQAQYKMPSIMVLPPNEDEVPGQNSCPARPLPDHSYSMFTELPPEYTPPGHSPVTSSCSLANGNLPADTLPAGYYEAMAKLQREGRIPRSIGNSYFDLPCYRGQSIPGDARNEKSKVSSSDPGQQDGSSQGSSSGSFYPTPDSNAWTTGDYLEDCKMSEFPARYRNTWGLPQSPEALRSLFEVVSEKEHRRAEYEQMQRALQMREDAIFASYNSDATGPWRHPWASLFPSSKNSKSRIPAPSFYPDEAFESEFLERCKVGLGYGVGDRSGPEGGKDVRSKAVNKGKLRERNSEKSKVGRHGKYLDRLRRAITQIDGSYPPGQLPPGCSELNEEQIQALLVPFSEMFVSSPSSSSQGSTKANSNSCSVNGKEKTNVGLQMLEEDVDESCFEMIGYLDGTEEHEAEEYMNKLDKMGFGPDAGKTRLAQRMRSLA